MGEEKPELSLESVCSRDFEREKKRGNYSNNKQLESKELESITMNKLQYESS